MADYLKPTPESDTCPVCSEKGLTLAVDKTHYHRLFFSDGGWSARPEHSVEFSDAYEATRVFCLQCGAYFHVPENIRGCPVPIIENRNNGAMLEQREELLRAAKRLLSLHSRRERELLVELAELEAAVNIVKEN